jgi:hypothetical protein
MNLVMFKPTKQKKEMATQFRLYSYICIDIGIGSNYVTERVHGLL